MPSRLSVVLIVGFWLATSAWLFVREFGSWLHTDRPPSLGIGLAEEAYTIPVPVRWELARNGEPIGIVQTTMVYKPDTDTFALGSRLRDFRLDFPIPFVGTFRVEVPRMESELRVTRDGELRACSSEGTLEFQLDAGGRGDTFVLETRMTGTVRGGHLFARARIASPLGEWEEELEPIPVPEGNVLNPMQPLDRLVGLRPGQRWEQSRFSPVEEVMRVALPKLLAKLAAGKGGAPPPNVELPGAAGERVLHARVASEPRTLNWHGQEVSCWVIEYYAREQELVARTWVSRENDRVLRQEAFERLTGEELVLEREN